MKKSVRQRHERSRCGAALVEMAVVLPLLLTIVMGIIEFGRALMVSQLVTNAAREGTRLAAMDGSTNTEVEAYVRQFVTTTLNVAPADINVAIVITAATGNPSPVNNISNAKTRDQIQLSVSVPFEKVSYMTPVRIAGNTNISGMSVTRHQ